MRNAYAKFDHELCEFSAIYQSYLFD